MLDKNTLVKITNRYDGMTGYSVPDLGIKRLFMAGETKEVTVEEIRKLNYSIGGMALLRDNFIIDNKELVAEILGEVEPEYYYEKEDIKTLLEEGSLDELKDCLDFAPKGAIDLVKQVAIETELNDIRKRDAILEKTGFNVTSAIKINKETSEDVSDQEEGKTRRVRKSTATTTEGESKRRVAAPKTTSKYKVVSKSE